MKSYLRVVLSLLFILSLSLGHNAFADGEINRESRDEISLSEKVLPYREFNPEKLVSFLSENFAKKIREGSDGFESRRLLVSAPFLSEACGAEEILKYDGLDQYILTYSSEKKTRIAYDSLRFLLGEDKVFVDRIHETGDILQEVPWYNYPYLKNDGTYTYSWGTDYMGMDLLKEYGVIPDEKVTVAIVDTGVDTGNFFFKGRKFSDDSYDFCEHKSGYKGMTDEDGHGSHVAGIVTDATSDNVEIMVLKAPAGMIADSEIIAAVVYAVDHGADVINLSFMMGSSYDDHTKGALDEALKKAKENNIIVVASSGNAGQRNVFYPASSPYTYAVGALDMEEEKAWYSNYGPELDFIAPGDLIYSAKADGDEGETTDESGTSMATPEMAAAFAWLKMYFPDESNAKLYKRMKNLCIDYGDPGFDEYYGNGMPFMEDIMDSAGHHRHNYKYTSKKNGTHTRKCTICDYKLVKNCSRYKVKSDGSIVCSDCGFTLASSFENGTLTISYADASFVNMRGLSYACESSEISSVVIEEGYNEVADECFRDVWYLDSVKLPSTLTRIGKYAFSGTGIRSLDLSSTAVTLIDDSAFRNGVLENIRFPKTLKRLGADAFAYNYNLKNLDFSSTRLRSCGDGSLSCLEALSNIRFPSTLKYMGYLQFYGDSSLEYLDLSNTSLTGFEHDSFYGCKKLRQVTLPKSFEFFEANVFSGCDKLKEVIFLGDIYLTDLNPDYDEYAFPCNSFKIIYPSNNKTWSKRKEDPDYYKSGGNITFKGIASSKFMTNCTLSLSSSELTYSGESQKPKVTVKDSAGNTLVKDTDYTLSMSSRTSVGKTSIRVTGKGAYYGSILSEYKVIPKKPVISKITASTGKMTVAMKYSVGSRGAKYYQIQYREVGKETWKKVNTTARSKSITGLKSGKKYEVRVRAYKKVGLNTYYSKYTGIKTSAAIK